MKCEILGNAETPRNYKVKLIDGTILKKILKGWN